MWTIVALICIKLTYQQKNRPYFCAVKNNVLLLVNQFKKMSIFIQKDE